MKKLWLGLWLASIGLILNFVPTLALAQSQRNPCSYLTTTIGSCVPVGYGLGTGTAPLPVGGLASVAAPTFLEGKPAYFSFDLTGGLRVSGGSGGGAITIASGAVASGAYASGSIASGAMVDLGTQADAVCGTATGTCSLIALTKYNNTATNNAIPLGVNGTVTGATGLTPGVAQTGTIVALNADLSSVGGTAVKNGGVAGSQGIGGTVATNVAITANPLNLGAQAVSSENTAVTTARQVQLVADLVGKLIVLPYANPENFVSGTITSAMTGTTSTSLVAAPASGLRNYITACTFSNAHATVGTDLILQDGSGGTTIWTAPAAAVYGGAHIIFPTPLKQPTTATALYAANVTTGASTKASCSGYKGA